jgi:hypothetical protein
MTTARKSNVSLVPRAAPAATPPPAARIDLPDGATAELRHGALELRDGEGRLLVRYADGAAEISAPAGDLRLCAPAGRVVVAAALDVAVEAGRDVTHRAGRRIDLGAARPGDAPQVRIDPTSTEVRPGRLGVEAHSARVVVGQAAVVAHAIVTTADRIAVSAARYELLAEHLVERARDALREVADLCETRAGRARTLVRGLYALSSGRTAMTSTDDTSIDGSRILLG